MMPVNLKRLVRNLPRIPDWPIGLHIACKVCFSEWDISQGDLNAGRCYEVRRKPQGNRKISMRCPVCDKMCRATTKANMEK